MWPNPKVFQSSTQFLHPPLPPPLSQLPPTKITDLAASPPLLLVKCCHQFSRRDLAIFTTSSLVLLPPDPFHLPMAQAEEPPYVAENSEQTDNSTTISSTEENPSNIAENSEPVDNLTTISSTEENPPNAAVDNSTAISSTKENPPNTAENSEQVENSNTISTSPSCIDTTPTKRAFLDISVNGEPIGRIVIGLYTNTAPVGTDRFSDIVSGAAGISYRRKEFIKITPNYVQHGGLRSYGVDAELAKTTGSGLAIDRLRSEWERVNGVCPGTKNLAGSVSIIVRDPLKPPPKLKVVAKNGRLEIDEEEIGSDPNGTEFVIATKDSPELDAAALVVGRVLEGMEVVKRIGEVKTVQENTSSPYFRVAKLIGDKRAVVADRGFNRPYSKVVVSNCGLLN
ncbi:hypothetical protein LOK49_LG14G00284 [Camellia lanceoleosa]|uniref:Uncharacterized protein n=1 Tax=Camellia lanceoleosa TaxID=1840588 RepID=A0ACC0F8S0_9ERIC|nr:hypothetical protein LOK49_LG14G00284 [Camellia lanceoleosa]